MLVEHQDRGEVMFTSGEPTLNPNLLRYLHWSRRLGYRTRGVITNGRRFSDPDYARKACRAGLNHVVVSIHGGHARLHDSLVRTPGAFEQTLAGIRELGRLRGEFGLTVHTSTVVQRRNHTAEQLEELYELLRPSVDQVVLNVIQPWGRGDTHFDRLVPRYGAMRAEFDRFLAAVDRANGPSVYLLDIPYCVTEGLPEEVRGYVERFVHYEAGETSHRAWADQVDPTAGSVGPEIDLDPALREKMDVARAYFDADGFAGLTRDIQNEVTRAKREACATCVYDRSCEGVWKNYLRRHGWDEFQPVVDVSDDEPARATGGAR